MTPRAFEGGFSGMGTMMWSLLDKRFEDLLGAFILAAMAVIAFINVIVRYCTSFSFAWTEEITINFFVWITMLGTARAFREGGHLGMTALYDSLPLRYRRICYWGSVLLGVCFFGALCWTGFTEVVDEIDLDATSEALGIPVWWYTIATPLFSLLIIFRIAQRAFEDQRTNNF